MSSNKFYFMTFCWKLSQTDVGKGEKYLLVVQLLQQTIEYFKYLWKKELFNEVTSFAPKSKTGLQYVYH